MRRTSRLARYLGIYGLALVAGAAGAAGGDRVAKASAPRAVTDQVVNGLETHHHPTTAALLYSANGQPVGLGNAEVGCSATLIGCRTVLTAAHCVEGERPNQLMVFLQHAGLFPVSRIAVHPRYGAEDADIAVLRLGAPVTGIAPSAVNTVADPARHPGSRGTIAGFGISAGSANDAGLKRAGEVVTASCAASSWGELSDRQYVCWRYDQQVGPAGSDSNTCDGDSGGPLFLQLGGRMVVAGVTSGGLEQGCGPGDVSYDANVYTYRGFVLGQLAGDATTTCGGLPAVGAAGTAVVGRAGALSPGQQVRYVFTSGGGGRELRFTLNSEDDGDLDADLYVKRGLTVSTSDYDCRQQGKSAFGACRLPSPAAGPWAVLVRAAAGAGRYQVTGTAFGATLTADAGSGGGGTGGGGSGGGRSCRGVCGSTPDNRCWCDAECVAAGDCCPDFRQVCAAGDACRQRVCGVDPYCCAVQWDEECDEEAARLCS